MKQIFNEYKNYVDNEKKSPTNLNTFDDFALEKIEKIQS